MPTGVEQAVPGTQRTPRLPLGEATAPVAAQARHVEDAGTHCEAD